MHGSTNDSLFHVRIGPSERRLEARLAAFLHYEHKHGRRVIVAVCDNTDAGALVERALAEHPSGTFLAAEESEWLVHSTDLAAWAHIQDCGELRSLSLLQRENREPLALGLSELSEPQDYADYVMLSLLGMIGPENVVASRAFGRVFTEENTAYTPGVRLYFDGHRIIDDGLAVWDGVHLIKVRDHLPLEPYLLAAMTAETLDPQSLVDQWTPRSFMEAADARFLAQRSTSQLTTDD